MQVGSELLGKVLDGLGQPLDGSYISSRMPHHSTHNQPSNPLMRPRVNEPLSIGVRAIDGLLTVGRGSASGSSPGSGVGKSTLLGMVARNTSADVNVIALIGERGREVLEFIEKDLGPEGLARSVVIVATSDQPALIRIKGALIATTIAEYFRDRGLNVMLDDGFRHPVRDGAAGSRTCHRRAAGDPRIYAVRVRQLAEAARTGGNGPEGSITAFYTVLVDGDDMNEPIADAVRGILDGHIVLSRDLAHKGHFPAIDILASISRVMKEIVPEEQQEAANELKRLLAIYKDSEDLINIGAYQRGSNEKIDEAIEANEAIRTFTRQKTDEKIGYEASRDRLIHDFHHNHGS